MITQWRLSNFKSVQSAELEIAPLTIIAGVNSTGKSTLLQSMLLMSQTLANQDASRAIVLNGHLVHLGEFVDIRTEPTSAEDITIGWQLSPAEHSNFFVSQRDPFLKQLRDQWEQGSHFQSIDYTVTFGVGGENANEKLNSNLQLSPLLNLCELVCKDSDSKYELGLTRTKSRTTALTELDFFELMQTNFGEGTEFEVRVDDATLEEIISDIPSGELIGCSMRHFLPDALSVRFDRAQELENAMSTLADSHSPFLKSSYRIPPKLAEALTKELQIDTRIFFMADMNRWVRKRGKRQLLEKFVSERLAQVLKETLVKQQDKEGLKGIAIPFPLSDSIAYTDSFFKHSLRYLGPLRDIPRAVYPLSGSIDARDLGLRGENAPAVFHQFKDQVITYIPPKNIETREPSAAPLSIAVQSWLQYLGVIEGISSKDLGKHGHELKVRIKGSSLEHDLTHAGVGVSQVFPIILLGLLAEPDACLLIEQPELHLHPRVQSLLADFFLSLVFLKKQCILETHSEYLVDRLRLLTALTPGSELLQWFQIYFAEKNAIATNFRKVGITKYGAIPNWPEGFFDQSQDQTERILAAATNKLSLEER
jgi:predicted ATPase